MKTLLSIILAFCILNPTSAQVFGNANHDAFSVMGENFQLFFKIETGTSDTGNFTHFGTYDHPSGTTCDIKFALYTDHATADRPDNLLATGLMLSPTDGALNETQFSSPVAIAPNTTYWIGFISNCSFGNGRVNGSQWPLPPLKYRSYSFFNSWPDPAGSSGLNTQGSVNLVTLWVIGNGQVLPVEMLSFEAQIKNDKVQLDWEVAQEINNSGWNIQRSTNGFSWETIGWKEGQNNSFENFEYQLSIITTSMERYFIVLNNLTTMEPKLIPRLKV